jgi:hypothetical protein
VHLAHGLGQGRFEILRILQLFTALERIQELIAAEYFAFKISAVDVSSGNGLLGMSFQDPSEEVDESLKILKLVGELY